MESHEGNTPHILEAQHQLLVPRELPVKLDGVNDDGAGAVKGDGHLERELVPEVGSEV